MSEEEASAVFKQDLKTIEGYVANYLANLGISEDQYTQNEFDALVAVLYSRGNFDIATDSSDNIGTTFDEALVEYYTYGNSEDVSNILISNGNLNVNAGYSGILDRRKAELDIFLYGNYHSVLGDLENYN